MATTSVPHRWKYDVYVSFIGGDVRKSFMDHLYKDFQQKGIHAFRDNSDLPMGEDIPPRLYKAIEESRFLIVVFSKNYASSSWCLRELVKILECKQIGNPKHEVRIIFYDVRPDVVRKQRRSYAEAFAKHELSNSTEVDKWKEALSMAANLPGYDLQDMTNGYESKFIDCISRDIFQRLSDGPLHVGENLVGIDFHFDKLDLSRFVGYDKVNMIGICGISGIGKTTLARAIYNLMYVHFEGSCFLEDVKEVTNRQGLIQAQLHIIKEIVKIEDLKIPSVSKGIVVLKRIMSSKPILLVLDDVDRRDQLEALAGSASWFYPGSLIIFTGKDKQLLRSHRVGEIHDMKYLDKDQSLQLFSLYAFKEKHPSKGFQELADQAVKYVKGHPLGLKVLGCFLYGKTVGQWISELDMLDLHPNEEIQQVLRLNLKGNNFTSLPGSSSQLSPLQQLGLKSGGGYFKKPSSFFSAESFNYKDHGNISDIEAVSEASTEKNLKQNIAFSSDELNPPSDPNREFIDGEVLSTSRTDSNYLQRAYILMRRKDFLHLMWCYPVKKEAEVSFGFLVGKFSSINKYIRTALDSSTDEYDLMEIQTLLQDLEEYLEDAAFDMEAYLPEDLLQNRLGLPVEFQTRVIETNSESVWSDVTEVHAKSIASATDQALRCIKDLKVPILGIWGIGVEEVTATLKDMPVLKNAFDLILFVRIKRHTSIKDLTKDIEEEIDLWKKRSSENPNKINVLDQLLNCLLFVDCSDGFFDSHEHQFRLSKWFQNVQIVMTSGSQLTLWQVELEIRIQDHLLPWNIFFKNVDIATMGKDSGIDQLAVRMVEKCDGHLLAIILLARALRGVVEIGVWELALHELVSSSQSGVITDVMVKVLRFVWPRVETVSQKCIIQFALQCTGTKFEVSSLINSWIISGVVKSETEAECAFEDLERLFLIEWVEEKFVRMRDETRVALLGHFIPRTHGLYLKQDGSESNEMPSIEEWDVREIHLTNNILSELPDYPKCPILVELFLHSNEDLMDVPITFFHNMPSLQVLNLSNTSLKTLPSSISMLTTLRKLFIRNCDLMMELPPEIGSLKHLKVFDSEGTQLICLPEQVGSLTKLECLKFSLYNFPDKYKRSNQHVQIVPVAELSKLVHLKKLSICVDLYGEWWENEPKLIINILPKLRNLTSLRLHFPTTDLFCMFIQQKSWEGMPIYQHLSNFNFIVGHLQQRLTSRLRFGLDKMFVKLPKCLKFTSTEGEIEVISRAMKHANALFLDRHWTLPSLSTFGLEEMRNLKFCLLVECSEMLEIVNGNSLGDLSQVPVLGSLEYISIHRMKSLSCIWNGPIHYGCLANLKTMVIHACPELRTIFTQGLLDNLTHIENLAVERCPKISSVVTLESNCSTSTQFLPSLKNISLLYLPELVTISNGTSIAPRLECLVVYGCQKLEKLASMEVSDHVKEIKGENEWWDGLKWCEPEWTSGQPEYLARVFIPLGKDGDIMVELADAVNFLPHVSDQLSSI